ncbi:competence pheromone ComX [Lysinibacillus mangiferihumi]|uniref:ComX pheromone n=1 Tax=Lysinibacillus mangiferihumi TaxID=1130819 RepID=A0A4U2Y1R6_9BACI|nr:competence pheromone ComX [Lysinibacillus mangiferihumi]TKI53001.1 competence pheromone ComX [Lysinibacillus mangiferihumi]
MKNIINYLMKDTEVLHLLKNNKICIIGISPEENKALIDVVLNKKPQLQAYYWK